MSSNDLLINELLKTIANHHKTPLNAVEKLYKKEFSIDRVIFLLKRWRFKQLCPACKGEINTLKRCINKGCFLHGINIDY